MLGVLQWLVFGAAVLTLSCEGSKLKQMLEQNLMSRRNKKPHKKTIGPQYYTNPAFFKAFNETPTGLVYEPSSDHATSKRFDLEMPIANTLFDCDPAKFPLKDKCSVNCGQKWGTPGTRNITVIIPAEFDDSRPVGLLLDIEGTDWTISMPEEIQKTSVTPENKTFDISNVFQALMDRFVGAKKDKFSLPPFVYIGLSLAGPGSFDFLTGDDNCGDGPGTPRDIELVTVSDRYTRFLTDEVLPYVANHPSIKAKYPNFKFTDDPVGRVVQGQSNGGGAAFKAVWFHPEKFGVAVSRSPALLFGNLTTQNHTEYPLENADFWVPQPDGLGIIANSEPVRKHHKRRFWINANERDSGTPNQCGPPGAPTKYGNILTASENTANLLAAKGHEVRYVYGLGACHTDNNIIFQELPNALTWAFSEWKKKLEGGKAGRV